jgi:general secretion pathway protein D
MTKQPSSSKRRGFRPLTVAIQGLSLATASSALLWTMGGGFDTPLPPLASAATNSEKPDKRGKSEKTEPDPAELSGVGTPQESETPTVKLNYMSSPWAKVIQDVARKTESQLVMDRVPKGRYSRRDSNKYNRHDAVRILNKELEPLGFRLLEKGDYLIMIDLPSQRPKYAPAVLPPIPREETAKHSTEIKPESPYERRIQSINGREAESNDDAVATDKTTGKAAPRRSPSNGSVRQVNHDDANDNAANPEAIPARLDDEPQVASSQVVFRPRHRSVVDLSKRMYRTLKPRSQLITSGRDGLPAFRIASVTAVGAAKDGKNGPARNASHFTISIDEGNEELLIDASPAEADAILKVLRTIDRPFDEGEPVQLAASTKYVCQIAHQLPAEIERMRAAKPVRNVAKLPVDQPVWVAEGEEQRVPRPEDNAEPRMVRPVGPGAFGDLLGNLKGEVTIESVDDLGVLILRGNEKDVEQVMKVIKELEKLSEATAPKMRLHFLKNVDAESLAELLTSVYEKLTKFPGPATQPRQNAAILPVTKPNSLLIVAPENDIEAILELVDELDKPVDPLTEFQVFHLKTAIAGQVETLITEFYKERKNLGAKVLVIADNRVNAVIVRAQPRDLDEIASLIRKLDRDETSAVHQLKVFPLKNAVAVEIAAVMNAAIQSVIAPPTSGGGGGGGGQQGGLQGLNVGQIDEQFKNVKSAVLSFVTKEGSLRSGILADIRITPDSRVNSLVVSASEQSMTLVEELIKQLDKPTATVSEIKVFTLANADAEQMVQQLNSLFNNQQQGGGNNQQRQNLGIALEGAADSSSSLVPLKFSVDKRTNSVIAVGAAEALRVVEAILLRLDESDVRARQNVVFRLQNSPATTIATAINQFYTSQRDLLQTDPNLVSTVEQLEKDVVIVPDTINNSLLVSATPRHFKTIEAMILKLDSAPRQVIIQALMVEVELSNTDEFGIELGFQDPLLFARSIKDAPVTYTTTSTLNTNTTVQNNVVVSQSGSPGFNFNNPSVPLGNNLGVPNAGTVAAQGLTNFSLGRVNNDLGFGGLVLSAGSDAVNVLIRALAAHRKIQVLSRPQIRALDNQTATIFSGQQIPIITSFTANGTTGVNTPVVTQKDAGIELQVVPRINADGQVAMLVAAQRSQYRKEGVTLSTDATGKSIVSPILDKSVAQTTVSVPTGSTVVIGGIINTRDEAFSNTVPFLGEIPFLGNLFRYDSRTTRRVELLIFLTPRIVTSAIEEEMIKEVEMARMHFIESEAESLHGPLRAIPSPDDVFNEQQPSSTAPSGPSPHRDILPSPARIPMPSPDDSSNGLPPEPMPIPPAPEPKPDSTTKVMKDPKLTPAGAARLRFTEQDDSDSQTASQTSYQSEDESPNDDVPKKKFKLKSPFASKSR